MTTEQVTLTRRHRRGEASEWVVDDGRIVIIEAAPNDFRLCAHGNTDDTFGGTFRDLDAALDFLLDARQMFDTPTSVAAAGRFVDMREGNRG